MRRRCSSPHWPRTCGLRSAVGQGARLVAQHVGRVAYVGHLLVELGLPRHAVVGEVAQLVLQPLEPVLDDRVVGDALLERDDGESSPGGCVPTARR